MEDRELLKALDDLVKLTPEEEEAADLRERRIAYRDAAERKRLAQQRADPNSNTSLKKERKRLEARTPAQVRRDEIVAERKRLRDRARTINTDAIIYSIDHGKKDIRRHAAEVKATKKKRSRRYRGSDPK